MPKLITAQITTCPKCGANEWLMWLLVPGETLPDVSHASAMARQADEARNLRRVLFFGPFNYFLSMLGRKRHSGVPSSAEVAHCKTCGFERTFSRSPTPDTDSERRTITP